jgi:radical SAM superfamily enzyme YgiQ (UPF0313 family)
LPNLGLDLLWQMGVRHLVWQDDCLPADKASCLKLCDVLADHNFSWFGTTRVDCFDLEIAKRAADAGCYEMTFGGESGSPTILRKMNNEDRS